MELKYYDNGDEARNASSNRTFMELKSYITPFLFYAHTEF